MPKLSTSLPKLVVHYSLWGKPPADAISTQSSHYWATHGNNRFGFTNLSEARKRASTWGYGGIIVKSSS
jgi:hypothetical protein